MSAMQKAIQDLQWQARIFKDGGQSLGGFEDRAREIVSKFLVDTIQTSKVTPGTVYYRFQVLMDELDKRFKDPEPFSAQPPEPRLLKLIDEMIAKHNTVMLRQSGEDLADQVIRHNIQPRGSSMVGEVLLKCYEADLHHKDRDQNSILNHVMSEIGEVAIEVNIANGQSYKQPGPDGIVGEAVDAICALVDLIYKTDPNITEDQLADMARIKCAKWIANIKSHADK